MPSKMCLYFVKKNAQAVVPDGSKYVETVPDGKYLCPDRPSELES